MSVIAFRTNKSSYSSLKLMRLYLQLQRSFSDSFFAFLPEKKKSLQKATVRLSVQSSTVCHFARGWLMYAWNVRKFALNGSHVAFDTLVKIFFAEYAHEYARVHTSIFQTAPTSAPRFEHT